MTRICFDVIGSTLYGCAILVALVPNGFVEASETPLVPNIVVILADDLGQGDIGCYNADSKIPTPQIDSVAAGGIRFTDAHSPSSVCTPTRYGLLTGRYCWRTHLTSGVLNGYSPALIEPGRLTIASMLKQCGYHTACVGKWHLGLGTGAKTDYARPLIRGGSEAGFDEFYVVPASLDMPPYVWVQNDHVVEPATIADPGSVRRWVGGGGYWRAGLRAATFVHGDVLPLIARKSVEYIEERLRTAPQQPFFLYVPLTAPHTPWLPTAPFVGTSGAGHYGDFVAQVDWTVGEIVAALSRFDASRNTLLIITADNGSHWRRQDIERYGHEANNGLRGMKADIHEGGHRIPMIARWPGRISTASVSRETICLTDLMATVAAIVGYELPENAGEDSFNILPALLSEEHSEPLRDSIVHHSLHGMFAIRQGDWKLIQGRGSGGFTQPRAIEPEPNQPQGQLYNLRDDPAERHNLWSARPEIVSELSRLLDDCKSQGRSVPVGSHTMR